MARMKGRPSHLKRRGVSAAGRLTARPREHLLRQTTVPAGVAQRARVLLAITPDTASITRGGGPLWAIAQPRLLKWLHRYLAQGIAGLSRSTAPGRLRARSAQDV